MFEDVRKYLLKLNNMITDYVDETSMFVAEKLVNRL